MSYFTDLGLAEPILRALEASGYDTPTPIQTQAIPALLEGRDLCGIAQTGTGKTAAFALPSLDYLARNPKPRPMGSCRMLILSPTRELAAQIAENFRKYGRFLKLSVETVFGGVPIGGQIRKLQGGVDVLVATPGRLLDLIDQRAFNLKGVEIFVLDEADQMMDMGFIQPLRRVVRLLPAKRQSLFFSATMPSDIANLSQQFLTDPVQVAVTPQSTTAERVQQYVTFINQPEKQALLTMLLRSTEIERALVFTRTKHGADRVVRFLEGAGIGCAAIHGNKSQAQRTTALQGFRDGRINILVATDIAARGIDVSGLSHVFNFELPNVPEQYVHRIGRTGRAGREGIAMSFCAPDEKAHLRGIERMTRVKLEPVPLPANFAEAAAKLPKPAPLRKGPDPRRGGSGRPARHEGAGRGGARSAPRGRAEFAEKIERAAEGGPVPKRFRDGGAAGEAAPQRDYANRKERAHQAGAHNAGGQNRGRNPDRPRNSSFDPLGAGGAGASGEERGERGASFRPKKNYANRVKAYAGERGQGERSQGGGQRAGGQHAGGQHQGGQRLGGQYQGGQRRGGGNGQGRQG